MSAAIRLTVTRGGASVVHTRTRAAHAARLEELNRLEERRKQAAPTHWGVVDEWYQAERNAIEALLAGAAP